MRKQYHFWPAADPGTGPYDAWDVDRLIDLSRDLPRRRIRVDGITELDTPYWTDGTGTSRTIRQIVTHTRLILAAELSYPVILGDDGRVMDGMHRIAKALLEGLTEVDAVQFPEPLEPDFRNVAPGDLSYER